MKPIKFKEANAVITAIDGKETPALKSNDKKGVFVVGYKLSFFERLHVLIFGKMWLAQATYNAKPKPFFLTINKYAVMPKRKK